MSYRNLLQAALYTAICASSVGMNDMYGMRARKGGTSCPVQKPLIKQKHTFTIKGYTIEAYSRKDAISRLKAQGKIKK